jgi:hypothetical protein
MTWCDFFRNLFRRDVQSPEIKGFSPSRLIVFAARPFTSSLLAVRFRKQRASLAKIHNSLMVVFLMRASMSVA